MSRDSSRLSRLGVLAPAALSACMDASVLAVPAAGAIVSTVLKELSKAFMLKKWFHGTMSAKEAESLMMEKGKNGSYLVRESRTRPGELVLSVRVRGRVTHVMIRRQHDKYDVGSGEQFDDLVGLIEHFRSYPIVETSGDVLRLLQPVSGTRLRAQDIHKKIKEDKVENNNCSFDTEFQSVKVLDERLQFTSYEGAKIENAAKNRYRNVLPYDQTRVILRRRGPESDYINASYIHTYRLCKSDDSVESSNESLNSLHSSTISELSNKEVPPVSRSLPDIALKEIRKYLRLDKAKSESKEQSAVKTKSYIATQGCLPTTTEDFWHMVWQEDVRVIVMITKEYENGQKKCERYWPHIHEEEHYGDVNVKSISEANFPDYIVREFNVTNHKSCGRTIYQYQFTCWPDHGTPEKSYSVLSFIEDINRKLVQIFQSKNAPLQNMICVHCSAGVGRTGTFIALDMVIDKIKSLGCNCGIDVLNTVKLIRAQRSGMVQNKAQYRFIYLALQNYLENINIV